VALNWKEIDQVLEELPLEGSYVQKVVQPDYRNLVLSLHRPGQSFHFLCSLEQGKARIHRQSRKPQTPAKQQRFAQFLRSRIKGGRIEEARQIHQDRIVKLSVNCAGERTLLWIRLWGGQANIIATDEGGVILDAFYRRPKRNEVSGEHYDPDADTKIHEVDPEKRRRKLESYELREIPGEGDYNARLEAWYLEQDYSQELEQLRHRLLKELESREARMHSKLETLENKEQELGDYENYKIQGDLIMANIHRISKGDRWLSAENFYRDNQPVEIRLDPNLDAHENAEQHYDTYKRSKQAVDRVREEISNLKVQLRQIEQDRQEIENSTDVRFLRSKVQPSSKGSGSVETPSIPGMEFRSMGFRILVGRTARENDELLRRHVKGNDVWLHVRDAAGAYVFVRHLPGKSVPLDVLLDAGNLAIYYSKARQAGQADLYYTYVKYLRRAKHGKLGLVIPTQEKNLSVKLEEERLQRLWGVETRV
jgi:predicted ribosome quality control (RQC) complex YloA/Tae2 family protein